MYTYYLCICGGLTANYIWRETSIVTKGLQSIHSMNLCDTMYVPTSTTFLAADNDTWHTKHVYTVNTFTGINIRRRNLQILVHEKEEGG